MAGPRSLGWNCISPERCPQRNDAASPGFAVAGAWQQLLKIASLIKETILNQTRTPVNANTFSGASFGGVINFSLNFFIFSLKKM